GVRPRSPGPVRRSRTTVGPGPGGHADGVASARGLGRRRPTVRPDRLAGRDGGAARRAEGRDRRAACRAEVAAATALRGEHRLHDRRCRSGPGRREVGM
ncbi:MAG: hypothetical protein AVDCRST_MAG10-3013, partial [uncultured Acidimicrobiales bacterium]